MANLESMTFVATLPDGHPFGGRYELRAGDQTGIDDLDVRRETGSSLFGLVRASAADSGMTVVVVAAVVWLVRRKDFEGMTFRAAASQIKWGDDFKFDIINDDPFEPKQPGKEEDSEANSAETPSSRSRRTSESGPGKSTS